MNDKIEEARIGIFGLAASGGGTLVSLVDALELWLRLSSLAVGLIIGIITLWRMVRRKRKASDE